MIDQLLEIWGRRHNVKGEGQTKKSSISKAFILWLADQEENSPLTPKTTSLLTGRLISLTLFDISASSSMISSNPLSLRASKCSAATRASVAESSNVFGLSNRSSEERRVVSMVSELRTAKQGRKRYFLEPKNRELKNRSMRRTHQIIL